MFPGQEPRCGLPDLPVPAVTEGTVLVKAQAAALNPVDSALAARTMAQMITREYPLVLGRDAAGTVEAIGPGGHQRGARRRGDRVHAADPPVRPGTLGHHALPATAVTATPAGLDSTTAAAIPPTGTAALAAVDAIGVKPGQVVLVADASAYAVQLLAARGAAIVATGAADDAARLTRLGAAAVVDYLLLTEMGQAGLPVRLRVEGQPAPLPPGVDLAAYRIVQEALTNTRATPARHTPTCWSATNSTPWSRRSSTTAAGPGRARPTARPGRAGTGWSGCASGSPCTAARCTPARAPPRPGPAMPYGFGCPPIRTGRDRHDAHPGPDRR
jgi:hypothetical protein